MSKTSAFLSYKTLVLHAEFRLSPCCSSWYSAFRPFEQVFDVTTNKRRKQIMGLLDSLMSAASGNTEGSGGAAPLIGILGGLLAQSGGLQGLASKFAQSGHGNAFQSWVGMGENQPISSGEVQNVLGSEQVKAIANRMGIDPAQASNFLAEYLPKVVDKLTPAGKIESGADHQQGLAALLPSLLQSLGGQSSTDTTARA
jgi:uncharacterized protein YidB (DUF937 family)